MAIWNKSMETVLKEEEKWLKDKIVSISSRRKLNISMGRLNVESSASQVVSHIFNTCPTCFLKTQQ